MSVFSVVELFAKADRCLEMLIGPHEGRFLVGLLHIARRSPLEIEKAAQAAVNGGFGAVDSALPIDQQPCDRVLKEVQISIGVHGRHADSQENPAFR